MKGSAVLQQSFKKMIPYDTPKKDNGQVPAATTGGVGQLGRCASAQLRTMALRPLPFVGKALHLLCFPAVTFFFFFCNLLPAQEDGNWSLVCENAPQAPGNQSSVLFQGQELQFL